MTNIKKFFIYFYLIFFINVFSFFLNCFKFKILSHFIISLISNKKLKIQQKIIENKNILTKQIVFFKMWTFLLVFLNFSRKNICFNKFNNNYKIANKQYFLQEN